MWRGQEHQGFDLAAYAEEFDVSHDANDGRRRAQRIGVRKIAFREGFVDHERAAKPGPAHLRRLPDPAC